MAADRTPLYKRTWFGYAKNILFVVVGCALLALGDAVFLTPFNIVSGGMVSLGIIVASFFDGSVLVNDIVVASFQVAFFLIGLIFLGKKVAAHTLLATIAYPLFYTLFFRTNVGAPIVEALSAYRELDGSISISSLILAAAFGGALAGLGCAITFLGHGSTGGFDVLSLIIAKYTSIKEGVTSFVFDALVILTGLLVFKDVVGAMVGIISALVCALFIQFIYVYSNQSVIVDIISDHQDEIIEYIHENMDHGTTLIDVVGGYSGEDRMMVRVCIYKSEMNELSDFIASVDPRAFVSFVTAKSINGEGFQPFRGYKPVEPQEVEPKAKAEEAEIPSKTEETPQKAPENSDSGEQDGI